MIESALQELERLLERAGGRLPEASEERARGVLAFADERLRIGGQTVVALAGATGSGKSSLFNRLSGTELAQVAARRPTTSKPLALSFSATNGHLLNLLRITRRHEAHPPTPELADVVLLDLPDHDSTHLAHRAEVDRLLRIVDQFVFVVDPQKYADHLLHERYLRPLAGHRDVIAVVLNQSDRLTNGEPLYPADGAGMHPRVAEVVEHLRRLLADDGLEDVPVFATDASTGEGVDLLRAWLGRVAERKTATRERLTADLRQVVQDLQRHCGRDEGLAEAAVDELKREARRAAGVQRLGDDVRRSVRRRGAMLQRWRGTDDGEHLALPGHRVASPADDAVASSAVRAFVTSQTAGLPERWRDEVRARVMAGAGAQLPARLDRVMREVDLTDMEAPLGWGLVRTVKWLPVVAVVGLAAWFGYGVLSGDVPRGVQAIATIVGVLVALVVVSLLGDWALRFTARRAGATTTRRLRAVVDEEVESSVVAAVQHELDAHHDARAALQRMAGILARG